MRRIIFVSVIMPVLMLASACSFTAQMQAPLTATAETATAAMWTDTFTPTPTFTVTDTPTSTFTSTFTPSITLTPTITDTPTITPTPTFDFPKVTVNVANAACLFGPAKAYLWKFGVHQGDTGFVGGRAANSNWLYVKFDVLPDYCWISPFVVDVTGDVKTVTVQPVVLWITGALYEGPKWVRATRKGDQVTVTWAQVFMTEDDDRGYFLDVWVCQNGMFVWVPASYPDQFTTSMTFTDGPGCSQPSGGQIYAVEKHGYIPPKDIPWPAQ